MTAYSPITPAIRAELEARLSPSALITEPARLEDYAGDASCLRHLPELVVCAQNVADVQALLTLANQHRFPVTPRGSGSGLAGACLPDRGGVVLSTRRSRRHPHHRHHQFHHGGRGRRHQPAGARGRGCQGLISTRPTRPAWS